MDLLIAIQNYIAKLIEKGFYPKKKKPSLGKLEKMADLCMAGKIRKLSRYIPKNCPEELKKELFDMIDNIKEICKNDKESN